jgi:hypothetical protein
MLGKLITSCIRGLVYHHVSKSCSCALALSLSAVRLFVTREYRRTLSWHFLSARTVSQISNPHTLFMLDVQISDSNHSGCFEITLHQEHTLRNTERHVVYGLHCTPRMQDSPKWP